MKITAEFNSTQEMAEFISTFGAKGFIPEQGSINIDIAKVAEVVNKSKATTKKEDKPKKEDIKVDNTPNVEAEKVGVDETATDTKEAENVQDVPKQDDGAKVTKEMVRAAFSKLISKGKQADAKKLTAKYGASKLPDVKPKDYAAILEEAEALL